MRRHAPGSLAAVFAGESAGRLDLRLSPAERDAFTRAAGVLSVPAWARAVLASAAGVAVLPRGRGADRVVRKRRGAAKTVCTCEPSPCPRCENGVLTARLSADLSCWEADVCATCNGSWWHDPPKALPVPRAHCGAHNAAGAP